MLLQKAVLLQRELVKLVTEIVVMLQSLHRIHGWRVAGAPDDWQVGSRR